MRIARLTVNQKLSPMFPSEYCLDDGNLYQGAAFRLGKVNVFGVDAELAALKNASLVAVIGETKKGLDTQLKKLGPCPDGYEPEMVQMRSDWVPPEGGPRTTRATLAALPYQEGKQVIAVEMAEVVASDETSVRVRITNPFTLPLAGLRFVAHYEGGRGKPMASYEARELPLGPGAELELALERQSGTEPSRTKLGSDLRSLQLTGRLGQAELDIDILLPRP